MRYLRELTAASFVMGPFVDSTDGVTAETALVMNQNVIRLSKNGGAFAGKDASDAAVHKESGYYGFNLGVLDVNTPGSLLLCATTTGALPVWAHCMVLASPVYDSLVLGSDKLQVDVREIEGADPTDTIRDSVVDDATRIDASDLNSAADRVLLALPNAAADAAGGLPISDAGGLDLDTLLGRLDAAVTTRATPAQVNAEVLDVLNVDTFSELSAVPGASPTLRGMLHLLFMLAKNKITQTATEMKVFKDDSATALGTRASSDDGSTMTQAKMA